MSWLLPRGQSTGVNADTGLHVEVTPYEASIQGRLRCGGRASPPMLPYKS